MIKITVPATSANLGIGYDTLGMAVSLYSHFTFERADKLTITGCPEEFQNENNLVYVSFVDALAAWGEPAFPVAIDIQTDVPVARGLGSSSTCVVAGIMAAAALTGHTVDRAELVRIATEVEGHPDNVAPAILGGAVCSFTPTDSLPQCLRYEVSDRLRFITVIPPYEVHTSEARKVVPQEIPLSTAVWQMGRIAGMTRGLESGNLDLIAAANDDRIQAVGVDVVTLKQGHDTARGTRTQARRTLAQATDVIWMKTVNVFIRCNALQHFNVVDTGR